MRSPSVLGKGTLAWLLLAVFAVVIPHARYLPIWVVFFVLLVLLWRMQIYRKGWPEPNRWAKFFLVFSCGGGLFLHFQTLLGLEPMVALLLISLTLKLLEMYTKRDAVAVIYLSFFSTSAQFLFGQTLVDFFYGIVCFVLIVAALIALNSGGRPRATNLVLPTALRLTLQSVPLMVVLFLFFPRMGSLWSVPLPQNMAQTGVSDRVAPGDIARLTQGGGKAFTVSFDGPIPANNKLYWRGIVLTDFDGRSWTINRRRQTPFDSMVKWRGHNIRSSSLDWFYDAQALGEIVSYQIILEPTQQPWLFALPKANLTLTQTGVTREFTQVAQMPISRRMNYRVTSALHFKIDAAPLPDWYRQRNLSLPDGFNPETTRIARNWREQGASDREIVDRFLAMVTKEYTYTLEPKRLGRHTVDEFLWQTKEGYCEHFASAFVVFMRAAGIPARVVAGYQGGEVVEDFLQVSQADAHAWAEIWLPEEGWKRVDPTAAIAPERVESGIRTLFDRSVRNPLSMEAYRHIKLINNLRLQIDVLNYKWQMFVLNYDTQAQFSLLRKLFGKGDWSNAAVVLVSMVGTCLGLIALLTLFTKRRGQRQPAEVAALKPLLNRAARAGLERHKGESISAFIARLALRYPHCEGQLLEIASLYEGCAYAAQQDQLVDLSAAVKRCKLPGNGRLKTGRQD